MKQYLENRIKELNEADAKACEKRWNMKLPKFERDVWREQSNKITFARQELQQALKILNAQSESQNVSGNEGEKEVCEHEESPLYDVHGVIVAKWCLKCGDILA